MNLDPILQRIRPDDEERQRVHATVQRLEARLDQRLQELGLDGQATVQGSIAKDTWLAGAADLDCFLLLPADADLADVAKQAGAGILEDARHKYAQHPYLIGSFDGMDVDLVPAVRIQDPRHPHSAVDRTPFHTAWVKDNLDQAGRDQVRLAKRWAKGVGVYGAETSIGGFSGYLLEVLVQVHDGFQGLLDWLADDERPMRIATAADEVDDDVSPLVVVDPVDPTRNCAAAVQRDVLGRASHAARSYAVEPTEAYFFPAPARAEPADLLATSMAEQQIEWTGLTLAVTTDRLDIVFPQFQRAARQAAVDLERSGFEVRRLKVAELPGKVGIQWVTTALRLPPTSVRQGPPVHVAKNADKFREKWQDHPDAAGEVTEVDGRLQIEVHVRARTAAEVLQSHAGQTLTGKHVQAGLTRGHAWFLDPADVPTEWAPEVADEVLDRRPWQR